MTDEKGARLRVRAVRLLKDDMLVARVKGVASREAAAALTGVEIFVRRDQLPPPSDDEFYWDDLIGLMAVTSGAALGRVVGLMNYGAGDIVEIASEGAELPPAVYANGRHGGRFQGGRHHRLCAARGMTQGLRSVLEVRRKRGVVQKRHERDPADRVPQDRGRKKSDKILHERGPAHEHCVGSFDRSGYDMGEAADRDDIGEQHDHPEAGRAGARQKPDHERNQPAREHRPDRLRPESALDQVMSDLSERIAQRIGKGHGSPEDGRTGMCRGCSR